MEVEFASARYQFDGAIVATTGDGSVMTIPIDEENRHYIMIMEWAAEGNEIEPYDAPADPDPVTVVRKLDYFSRMTNAEADTFQQGAQTRPYRERAMLEAATQFESSHELWGLLWQMNVDAFGEARAAELLAPS